LVIQLLATFTWRNGTHGYQICSARGAKWTLDSCVFRTLALVGSWFCLSAWASFNWWYWSVLITITRHRASLFINTSVARDKITLLPFMIPPPIALAARWTGSCSNVCRRWCL
jgi:hypothetical protein